MKHFIQEAIDTCMEHYAAMDKTINIYTVAASSGLTMRLPLESWEYPSSLGVSGNPPSSRICREVSMLRLRMCDSSCAMVA